MEKKTYEIPAIEVIELAKQPVLLAGTSGGFNPNDVPEYEDDFMG